MERLRPDEPVVQLRLEPVEQLPLQGGIPAGVALAEPPALVGVEDGEVGGTVAVRERDAGACHTGSPLAGRGVLDLAGRGPKLAAPVLAAGSCLTGGALDGCHPGSRIPTGQADPPAVPDAVPPIPVLVASSPASGTEKTDEAES
jgi:hypothetical protein